RGGRRPRGVVRPNIGEQIRDGVPSAPVRVHQEPDGELLVRGLLLEHLRGDGRGTQRPTELRQLTLGKFGLVVEPRKRLPYIHACPSPIDPDDTRTEALTLPSSDGSRARSTRGLYSCIRAARWHVTAGRLTESVHDATSVPWIFSADDHILEGSSTF